MHTRGPLMINCEREIFSKNTMLCEVLDTAEGLEGTDGEADANARLFAAAYTSYDRHFGEGGVAAAEQDALGEAIWLLQTCLNYEGTPRALRAGIGDFLAKQTKVETR